MHVALHFAFPRFTCRVAILFVELPFAIFQCFKTHFISSLTPRDATRASRHAMLLTLPA
jgi:hypothetical protein